MGPAADPLLRLLRGCSARGGHASGADTPAWAQDGAKRTLSVRERSQVQALLRAEPALNRATSGARLPRLVAYWGPHNMWAITDDRSLL